MSAISLDLRVRSLVVPLVFILLILSPGRIHASESRITNSLGMEFVLVPAGQFLRGSPPEEPLRKKNELQHSVTISRSFYIQTTEVTQSQWTALMGRKWFGRRENGLMPVVRVSWRDCMGFIEKLNGRNEGFYRLPTEAEWEYACRAGTQTPYPWGEGIRCSDAMYANNTLRLDDCVEYVKSRGLPTDTAAPVGSYPPNAWDLLDMTGNVWEWCSDWYDDYPDHAVTDPVGPSSGRARVRRGGSWFGAGSLCRCANRNFGHPDVRYQTLGFRLVKEIPSGQEGGKGE
jgi:formylglycine-generating enzyme